MGWMGWMDEGREGWRDGWAASKQASKKQASKQAVINDERASSLTHPRLLLERLVPSLLISLYLVSYSFLSHS